MNRPSLLILGCGYIGSHLAHRAMAEGIHVTATTRSLDHAKVLERSGVEMVVTEHIENIPEEILATTDMLLDSIPLERSDDHFSPPQRRWLPSLTPQLTRIRWVGYLSSTSVYGDAGGAWIDESFVCHPTSARGQARLEAEGLWLDSILPTEIFRLAGIYGSDRNLIPKLKAGGYKTVRWQPPRYANRIHRDDIVAALLAAMNRPHAGRIINLCDDLPLPHSEYVSELAQATNAPAPTILNATDAERELSSTALDFFRDNKRLSNRKLHTELLPELRYPSFRDAITSL